MTYEKFEETNAIVRDTENKAVLAADISALMAHKKQRQQTEKIDKLEKDVADMKSTLDLILIALTKK